jgi:hypothetical protein
MREAINMDEQGGMSRRAYQRSLWKSTRGLSLGERKRRYAQGMAGYDSGGSSEGQSQGTEYGGVRWF